MVQQGVFSVARMEKRTDFAQAGPRHGQLGAKMAVLGAKMDDSQDIHPPKLRAAHREKAQKIPWH